jgi:hypothetical protein
MIFQDHRLLPDRTIFDYVALPLVVTGVHPREIGRRVRAALDQTLAEGFDRTTVAHKRELAAALGVWSMVFLSAAMMGAAILGGKRGGMFKV